MKDEFKSTNLGHGKNYALFDDRWYFWEAPKYTKKHGVKKKRKNRVKASWKQ